MVLAEGVEYSEHGGGCGGCVRKKKEVRPGQTRKSAFCKISEFRDNSYQTLQGMCRALHA